MPRLGICDAKDALVDCLLLWNKLQWEMPRNWRDELRDWSLK